MSTENLENENQNWSAESMTDMQSIEAAADPEADIVSQGVHNYSAAETYVRASDRPGCSAAARMVSGSETGTDDALRPVLPAGHGCFLGIK